MSLTKFQILFITLTALSLNACNSSSSFQGLAAKLASPFSSFKESSSGSAQNTLALKTGIVPPIAGPDTGGDIICGGPDDQSGGCKGGPVPQPTAATNLYLRIPIYCSNGGLAVGSGITVEHFTPAEMYNGESKDAYYGKDFPETVNYVVAILGKSVNIIDTVVVGVPIDNCLEALNEAVYLPFSEAVHYVSYWDATNPNPSNPSLPRVPFDPSTFQTPNIPIENYFPNVACVGGLRRAFVPGLGSRYVTGDPSVAQEICTSGWSGALTPAVVTMGINPNPPFDVVYEIRSYSSGNNCQGTIITRVPKVNSWNEDWNRDGIVDGIKKEQNSFEGAVTGYHCRYNWGHDV